MPRIKVLYDEQIFLLQEFGGISRYFTELIKAFIANPSLGIEPLVSSTAVRNEYILTEIDTLGLRRVNSQAGAIFNLLKQLVFNRKRDFGADLAHLTFYLPGYLKRFPGLPKVVTLYDMIPENTSVKKYSRNPHFSKKKYMSRADLVLSISESSTKDMLREYGFNFRVPTTYLGVGPEFKAGLPRLGWQPQKYFIFVGNRNGYKDCGLALKAFADVSRQNGEVFLQLVGGGPLSEGEAKLIESLGIKSQVLQRSVDSVELPNVYSNAIGLIYPSQYEGFGLPLVEAMACGTAILASDTAINREIAADAASYFPLGDRHSLSEEIGRLISHPYEFQDKIRFGIERAKEFTWFKCAQRTAEEYRELLERESRLVTWQK